MSQLISSIESAIAEKESKMMNDELLNSYIEASKTFEILVAKGIVQRRGHTLMTIEEARLKVIQFNNEVEET